MAVIATQIILLKKNIRDLARDPQRASSSLKELIGRKKRKTKRTAMFWIQSKVDRCRIPVEGGSPFTVALRKAFWRTKLLS